MIAKQNIYIQSAYDRLQVISQDKQKRMEYEARQKALFDHNQFMYEAEKRGREIGEEIGREIGREEGARNEKYNIARKLIASGMPIDTIVNVTGLSAGIIEGLEK